jgi:hypothetical protein
LGSSIARIYTSSSRLSRERFIARLKERGIEVNSDLAEGAALLHDIDKGLRLDDPYRALGHGAAGAAWLTDHGHGELADAVRDHPVNVIGNAAGYREWEKATTLESRLVAYADKRAGQRLETMDARFASWRRRYPGTWDVETWGAVRSRAAWLEADVCEAADVEPADVRRLAWTAAPVRAAGATQALPG